MTWFHLDNKSSAVLRIKLFCMQLHICTCVGRQSGAVQAIAFISWLCASVCHFWIISESLTNA